MGIYSERIFPWMLDRSTDRGVFHKRRARVVGPASGDVLEIGFGTGATLPFYDAEKVRSLTVVEPSVGMNKKAAKRIAGSNLDVRSEPLAGEDLPFSDESFDCVVCCLTLCSVEDPATVLAEVHRVLRPGGSFRYFEHVASEEPGWRRWQDRLNPVQRVVGVGCNLNRPTRELIAESGLAIDDSRLEIEHKLPLAGLFPFAEGVARKTP